MAKNKEKESTIGKVIYGFLMFAPLLAILTSCAYTIFNKNATEEFTRTETIKPNELVVGHTYTFEVANSTIENTTGKDNYVRFSEILELSLNGEKTATTNENQQLYCNASNNVYMMVSDGTYWNPTNIKVKGILKAFGPNPNVFTKYATEEVETHIKRDLRNTFYYSLEKIEEEPVFNWAKNNDIYTGIKNVCETMSITNNFYPMILTYWLIISTIYFIYDIILIIFHILHNNIHKLEDI